MTRGSFISSFSPAAWDPKTAPVLMRPAVVNGANVAHRSDHRENLWPGADRSVRARRRQSGGRTADRRKERRSGRFVLDRSARGRLPGSDSPGIRSRRQDGDSRRRRRLLRQDRGQPHHESVEQSAGSLLADDLLRHASPISLHRPPPAIWRPTGTVYSLATRSPPAAGLQLQPEHRPAIRDECLLRRIHRIAGPSSALGAQYQCRGPGRDSSST